ncbi:hypothetical protein [Nocardiopsis sp. B62]|uniref:hypothetical protein n=1 Tax=Nocardiopsis sp. B62 TaxID=2824874 RepID=UPI001B372052|nr:hypothetical protein [Nocardiopsis sp. B62]MBQ1081070.1 hypothetical protein [Nocardiopsis sp. B62]
MGRYLNLSELASVGWLASETIRPRRPRRAGRVRGYAAFLRPPLIPSPRRPLDTAPLDVLHAVLAGLRRLGVSL